MPHLQFRKKRGVGVLSLTELPLCNGVVREAVAALKHGGCCHAVIDLKGAAPDLSLLKPLLALRKRIQTKGRVVLCGLSAEMADWLRATWLLGLFDVRQDVDGALASLVNRRNGCAGSPDPGR
jgi:hypothetical protein